MDTTILQVPVKKDVRQKAAVVAKAMGFSSLQEAMRIFLTKLALKQVDIKFEEKIQLSEKNARRYDKMIEDIKSGRAPVYEAKDAKDLMDQLHERKNPILARVPKELQTEN